MARTRINVPVQIGVTADVDFAGVKIKNLSDPGDTQDAATKHYVDSQITSGVLGIGLAEDGSYTDGLFTDFTTTTTIGIAVDRFNEVLKSLAPQPAPSFSSVSFSNSGTTGKLSFGASNALTGYTLAPSLDVGGTYTASGYRKGIFNSSTTMTGTLADNVAPGFTNSRPYPNYAFGDANVGTLHLVVNGAVVHSCDLTSFASGTSATNGSGFVLSAATTVKFTNGDSFDNFKYRTGTWMVVAAAQRKGYNTLLVRHEYASGQYRDCTQFDWVVDDSTTTTSYTGDTLDTIALTGANHISGVTYYTGGSAQYAVTVNNAYKNTYSASATPVSFSGTNCSATAQSLATPSTEASSATYSAVPVTVNVSGRLLNGSISLHSVVDRVINANEANSGSQSISGILIDNTSAAASATSELFDDEGYRMYENFTITNTTYGSGAGSSAATWDSTESLVGADANYNSGLLVSASKLTYPTNTSHISGITNGNFSAPTNGPSGNPNYSAASGTRTYIRYFYTSSAKSNFRLNIAATNASFVSVATGVSVNNLTLEVLAPNTTKNSGGTTAWKDATVAHDGLDTDVGCYAGTYGSTVPTNWGCTLGAKNTSTSGGAIVVKITASQNWSGSLDSILLTWVS